VNIGAGDQFKPDFLKIAPNNRMPAIVDHEPADKGGPLSVFESGAILMYLGDKTGKFLPKELRARTSVMEWLFWQMGGLGPMSGQNTHFVRYAPEKLPYAMERYTKEVNRLYGVMDRRLAVTQFLGGDDYTIADMASYPWTMVWEMQQQKIADFPHLKRWLDAIAARPATVRAYEKGKAVNSGPSAATTEEGRRILFGQTAASVRKASG
jgi:GST-like protein